MVTSKFNSPQAILEHAVWIPYCGCMFWMGEITPAGYGLISRNGKRVGAHRIIKEMEIGRPLSSGEWVLHKCDNPSCVRPDHLFIGTPKENTGDKLKKGRANTAHGEGHPHSKLTENDVRKIRSMSGLQREIAEQFGVHQVLISLIKRGKCWRHVH